MDALPRNKGVHVFGRFRLDAARRVLTRDRVPITLTPRLFDTLLFLVENAGRVVEKDEILNAVWPDRFVEERNITQTIFTLRKALSHAGEEDRLIETVAGRGYRFTGIVRFESEASTDSGPKAPFGEPLSLPSEPVAGSAESRERPAVVARARRWYGWGAFACALLVLAAAGTLALEALSGHLSESRPPLQPNLIVFSDFENLTGDRALGAVAGKVLEIDIAQSPFLTPLGANRVRETLRLMARSPDSPLTPELAQEVCARSAGKAVLNGTVAAAGSRYIVTLEATDCVSGNSIAREKAETERKEDIPDALDGLAARMRQALNESLPSIRRFDVPIAQATTSSFEALEDFSLGERLRAKGDFMASLPLFKRAIELDPSFALAYEDLGADYASLREVLLTGTYYRKAFDLRSRTSANERLRIIANFYQRAGDFSAAIQAYQLWTQTYPRDWLPWSSLANFMTSLARYPEAIAAGKEALRLNPQNNAAYVVLARADKRANRFADAKAVCRQAIERGYDNWDIHGLLYEIAFAEGDRVTMAEQVAKERGTPTESWMLDYEALAAATAGQLKRAAALFEDSLRAARQQGPDARGEIAAFVADYVDSDSVLGAGPEARSVAQSVSGDDQSALSLAETGDATGAEGMIASLKQKYPGASGLVDMYLPLVQARIDLGRGRPQDAIEALQPELPYALRDFWAPSLLGEVWLDLGQADRAAAEYRRILANRGVDGTSPLYPLAWLGLARALRLQGKIRESRAAYEQLFAFWKEADPDLPVLLDARREYAAISNTAKASE